MTAFEEASERVRRAAQAGDLEAVALALAERAELLRAGAQPTVASFQMGEEAARFLNLFKQKLAAESSRLEQIRCGVLESMAPRPKSRIDLRG